MTKDELEHQRGLELSQQIGELVWNSNTKKTGTDIKALISVLASLHHTALLRVPEDLRDGVRKQAEDAILNRVREALRANLSDLVKQYLSNH